jgi:hypothetical protein
LGELLRHLYDFLFSFNGGGLEIDEELVKRMPAAYRKNPFVVSERGAWGLRLGPIPRDSSKWRPIKNLYLNY